MNNPIFPESIDAAEISMQKQRDDQLLIDEVHAEHWSDYQDMERERCESRVIDYLCHNPNPDKLLGEALQDADEHAQKRLHDALQARDLHKVQQLMLDTCIDFYVEVERSGEL